MCVFVYACVCVCVCVCVGVFTHLCMQMLLLDLFTQKNLIKEASSASEARFQGM